jgi:hypothetical protein
LSLDWDDPTTLAPLLWLALALFVLRVVGQLLVVTIRPRWLPPMEQWQSGLLPYPVLLGSQLLIIALMTAITRQFAAGSGVFVESAPRAGWIVFVLSWIYLGGMVFRYVWSMSRHPERRWLGKTIPIAFHCVLASFLFVVGGFHALGG